MTAPLTCRAQQAPATSTVVVDRPATQPVILQSLFNVAITTVNFSTPSFVLVPNAWAYVSSETPYVLDRNFTIRSTLSNPPTVIDWTLLDQKVCQQSCQLVGAVSAPTANRNQRHVPADNLNACGASHFSTVALQVVVMPGTQFLPDNLVLTNTRCVFRGACLVAVRCRALCSRHT